MTMFTMKAVAAVPELGIEAGDVLTLEPEGDEPLLIHRAIPATNAVFAMLFDSIGSRAVVFAGNLTAACGPARRPALTLVGGVSVSEPAARAPDSRASRDP